MTNIDKLHTLDPSAFIEQYSRDLSTSQYISFLFKLEMVNILQPSLCEQIHPSREVVLLQIGQHPWSPLLTQPCNKTSMARWHLPKEEVNAWHETEEELQSCQHHMLTSPPFPAPGSEQSACVAGCFRALGLVVFPLLRLLKRD